MGGVRQSPFTPAGPVAAQPPPQPPSPPPKRRHGGGHPRASPEAEQAVLNALDAGENAKTAAAAGGIAYPGPTVRNIWERHGRAWPPPGLGRGQGTGGGRPPKALTAAQVAHAAGRIGAGEAKAAVAKSLGVSRQTLYRAIKKEKRSEGEPQ